jgi:predicted glycoside hydrolase/deacetylase ChbG (UPF0249 family)
MAGRFLVVNADDLGLCEALNVTKVQLCSFAQV